MRLFIAIDLPAAQKQGAADLISRLKKTGADLKWTDPENIHITLAFLGEIEESRKSLINDSLRAAAAIQAPFDISFGRLGVFDSWKKPKVLWIEITRGADSLARLAEILEEDLFDRKILADRKKRPFKAHLTLGRLRSSRNALALKDAASAMENLRIEGFNAREIRLYRSRLSSAGPHYEMLSAFPLLGPLTHRK